MVSGPGTVILTGRPVKLALTREESIRIHPKRHPITMHLQVGCDEHGRLTAQQRKGLVIQLVKAMPDEQRKGEQRRIYEEFLK